MSQQVRSAKNIATYESGESKIEPAKYGANTAVFADGVGVLMT